MSAEEVRVFFLLSPEPMAILRWFFLCPAPHAAPPLLFLRARVHEKPPLIGFERREKLTYFHYSTMSPSTRLMPELRSPTPCSALLCARTATL